MVAKWWKVNPDIAERWTMVDFADRQEFMYVQFELSKDPKDRTDAGRTPWTGPKE